MDDPVLGSSQVPAGCGMVLLIQAVSAISTSFANAVTFTLNAFQRASMQDLRRAGLGVMEGSMDVTDELRREFAPTGVLRAALNHGNRVLVSRDEDGTARGITIDLAHALASELGLPLEFVHFDKAGDVTSAATSGVYDVCFL